MSTGWAIALGVAVAVITYVVVWVVEHDSYDTNPVALPLLFATVTGLIAFVIPYAINEERDFRENCAAAGGHTREDTQVASNGGVTTTWFCLSADGRILEIG